MNLLFALKEMLKLTKKKSVLFFQTAKLKSMPVSDSSEATFHGQEKEFEALYHCGGRDSPLSDTEEKERGNVKRCMVWGRIIWEVILLRISCGTGWFYSCQILSDVKLKLLQQHSDGHDGRQLRIFYDRSDVERTIVSLDGKNIVTTLDVGVQPDHEKYVNGFKRKMGIRTLAGVVPECTGEILAMDTGDHYQSSTTGERSLAFIPGKKIKAMNDEKR